MSVLRYDEDYEVDLGDHVEFRCADGLRAEGQVTRMHPRLGAVTVRYEDHQDFYRTSGNPRVKSERLAVGRVDFIRRDG